MIQFRITQEKETGMWFGLIYDTETDKPLRDKCGNKMDSKLYDPYSVMDCLVGQMFEEFKREI